MQQGLIALRDGRPAETRRAPRRAGTRGVDSFEVHYYLRPRARRRSSGGARRRAEYDEGAREAAGRQRRVARAWREPRGASRSARRRRARSRSCCRWRRATRSRACSSARSTAICAGRTKRRGRCAQAIEIDPAPGAGTGTRSGRCWAGRADGATRSTRSPRRRRASRTTRCTSTTAASRSSISDAATRPLADLRRAAALGYQPARVLVSQMETGRR